MPSSIGLRFRLSVISLIVTAYLLIAAAVVYGHEQRRAGEHLECAVAAAQIVAVRAALDQPGQTPALQAARRQVLLTWQDLSRSYGCN